MSQYSLKADCGFWEIDIHAIHVMESTLGNCNKFEGDRVEADAVSSQSQSLFVSERKFLY